MYFARIVKGQSYFQRRALFKLRTLFFQKIKGYRLDLFLWINVTVNILPLKIQILLYAMLKLEVLWLFKHVISLSIILLYMIILL